MSAKEGEPEKWPEVVFTERFPKFYIDKMHDGNDYDKVRAAWKVYQAVNGNNHNAKCLKDYEGGLDSVAAFYKADNIEGKDLGGLQDMIGNMLHMLGHPDFKDGFMQKGSGVDYFNTMPYIPPQPAAA